MKILISLSLFFVLGLLPVSFAFEYFGTLEYFGVNEDPKFCIIEDKEDQVFLSNKQMLQNATEKATAKWQKAMKEGTNNFDSWNIYTKTVEMQNRDKPLHQQDCDAFILFIPDLDGGYTSGYTSMAEGIEKPVMEIVYNEVEFLEKKDELGFYWEAYYTGNIIPEKRLVLTIMHEIGHVFGLDHYLTNDSTTLENWDRGFVNPPSLMIEVEPLVGYQEITELDIKKMIEIYGQDGFGETDPERKIPDWIKQNAEWWVQGLVSDDEYLDSIEYLIKNRIIIV